MGYPEITFQVRFNERLITAMQYDYVFLIIFFNLMYFVKMQEMQNQIQTMGAA